MLLLLISMILQNYACCPPLHTPKTYSFPCIVFCIITMTNSYKLLIPYDSSSKCLYTINEEIFPWIKSAVYVWPRDICRHLVLAKILLWMHELSLIIGYAVKFIRRAFKWNLQMFSLEYYTQDHITSFLYILHGASDIFRQYLTQIHMFNAARSWTRAWI